MIRMKIYNSVEARFASLDPVARRLRMGCTEGYLQNKRQKLRNLLAMATDCDTPDEHYFRENTPNSSSYSHRQQFSHPTSWRHGLPFQRITSKHTADSRHTGCGRRYDHASC